jgi:peptidoglycan/xylan/chitin deacetylase (PgdA/CDA1 family)
MRLSKSSHDRLRSLVPQSVRERMYELHPGRGRRWQKIPGLQLIATEGRAVVTFDDGPDVDATPAVLDALDEAGARATFFVVASQMLRWPALIKEVRDRGHEIGLHGYEHQRQDQIAPERSRDDVVRGFEAIGQMTGERCRWYRPPFGRMSTASATACEELGLTPVYWSAWGLDWEDVAADRIADVASSQLQEGGILLLHDSARYGRRPSAVATARAIPAISAHAADSGIALVSLGEATCT